MTPGDLILYKSTGKWYERLITLATHGPYTHVALVANASQILAADTQGIGYDTLPPADGLHTVVSLAPYTTPDGIARGLAWAEQQRGRRYGWADIVYQGVKFLWPSNPLRFGVEGRWDCADFAVRYLQQAGIILPDVFEDSYADTPNDIARMFGIIEPLKPQYSGIRVQPRSDVSL